MITKSFLSSLLPWQQPVKLTGDVINAVSVAADVSLRWKGRILHSDQTVQVFDLLLIAFVTLEMTKDLPRWRPMMLALKRACNKQHPGSCLLSERNVWLSAYFAPCVCIYIHVGMYILSIYLKAALFPWRCINYGDFCRYFFSHLCFCGCFVSHSWAFFSSCFISGCFINWYLSAYEMEKCMLGNEAKTELNKKYWLNNR